MRDAKPSESSIRCKDIHEIRNQLIFKFTKKENNIGYLGKYM